MKMLYKYPQNAFPYDDLLKTNAERNKNEPEYELIDTGIFDDNEYFDIFIEYAKENQNDILIKVTVVNKADKDAALIILPTIWFRNTWNWGYDDYRPQLSAEEANHIRIDHQDLEVRNIYAKQSSRTLFCDNETNSQRLYQSSNGSRYCKDGINDFVLAGNSQAVNPKNTGTKASFYIDDYFKAKESKIYEFRLSDKELKIRSVILNLFLKHVIKKLMNFMLKFRKEFIRKMKTGTETSICRYALEQDVLPLQC